MTISEVSRIIHKFVSSGEKIIFELGPDCPKITVGKSTMLIPYYSHHPLFDKPDVLGVVVKMIEDETNG